MPPRLRERGARAHARRAREHALHFCSEQF